MIAVLKSNSSQTEQQALQAQISVLQHEVAQLSNLLVTLQEELADVRTALFLDPLTEVSNRRAFDKALLKEWQRCRRDGKSLAVLMIDIDYFKKFNDTHGHIAGDIRLVQVARAISTTVKRPGDIVARYGGEEFVVLLPETDLVGAVKLAKQILVSVRGTGSSVSIGVAAELPQRDSNRYRRLLHRADKAMYEAKQQGRNRLVIVKSH